MKKIIAVLIVCIILCGCDDGVTVPPYTLPLDNSNTKPTEATDDGFVSAKEYSKSEDVEAYDLLYEWIQIALCDSRISSEEQKSIL